MKNQTMVYLINVTLKNIKPKIWREFEVLSNINFSDLHYILQDVMGWSNSHLHKFVVGNLKLTEIDEENRYETEEDETTYILSDMVHEKSKFLYVYDFGDDWEHILAVKKVYPIDLQKKYPICTAGQRACPPEDCGSYFGYENYFEALEDPTDSDNKQILEWFGDYDPEEFNIHEINEKLKMSLKV